MPAEEFRAFAHQTVDWITDFLNEIDEVRVLSDQSPGALTAALPTTAPEDGDSMAEVLADFREHVVPGITHWNHPGFFGYFSVTGSGPGILGEMLTAALNVNAMLWRSSPAATELEFITTGWLRELVGLPGSFEGVINDTASSSTFYALVAAREQAYPEARQHGLFGAPPGRIYASSEAHSSIEKGVLAAGFGRSGYRALATDAEHRLDPAALRSALEEDVANGVRPVAVVATLGTTSSAALDPVGEIASICREAGVWLHVDAAYGGPAAVDPELRHLFRGWEAANSIVINPHKWLFTQIDCSVLYCREPSQMVHAFSLVPEYLSARDDGQTRNLMDYGLSLGRRFRSLKLWFVLRYFGAEGLRRRIRAHVEMAKELAAWIDAEPGWEVVAPVELGLVVFRRLTTDDDNLRIMEAVNASGEAFLSHTRLGDHIVLRCAIGNVRTTRHHIARLWEALRRQASLS